MLGKCERKIRCLQSQETIATPRNLEGACTSGADAGSSSSSGFADKASCADKAHAAARINIPVKVRHIA
jgi:ApbE superfamily uncharacterized protein (UPF0280 family)